MAVPENVTYSMKNVIKTLFKLLGLKVSRLNPPQEKSYVLKVGSPIEFNSKENLELLYKDIENLKHHQFSESRINFCKEILNQLKLNDIILEEKCVADVGCGTGQLLKLIAESNKARRIVGYEYSEEALKVARSFLPSVSFFHSDIYEKFLDKFDVLFCIEVLEHLLYPWKALENISSMLLPHGVLIITVPNGRLDQWNGHINFWSPESWKAFLEEYLSSKEFTIQTYLLNHDSLIAIIKKMS